MEKGLVKCAGILVFIVAIAGLLGHGILTWQLVALMVVGLVAVSDFSTGKFIDGVERLRLRYGGSILDITRELPEEFQREMLADKRDTTSALLEEDPDVSESDAERKDKRKKSKAVEELGKSEQISDEDFAKGYLAAGEQWSRMMRDILREPGMIATLMYGKTLDAVRYAVTAVSGESVGGIEAKVVIEKALKYELLRPREDRLIKALESLIRKESVVGGASPKEKIKVMEAATNLHNEVLRRLQAVLPDCIDGKGE